MRPDTSQEMKIGWISIVVVAVLCLLINYIVSDGGKTAKAIAVAQRKYESHKGDTRYPLSREIEHQAAANVALTQNIEDLKGIVGIKAVPPFLVPADYMERREEYFFFLYQACVAYLRPIARANSVQEYSTDLGFEFANGNVLKPEEVKVELIRLQLIERAVLLALSTPNHLQEITVIQHDIAVTGPAKRPPLLREYPFTLRVRGSLKDILWLLHQYSANTAPADTFADWNTLVQRVQRNMNEQTEVKATSPDDYFPLILRGLKINSKNSEPLDQVQQLEAEFELAGMEFLTDAERQAEQEPATGRRRGRMSGL